MAFVDLSNLPDPLKEYTVTLEQLSGGLNIWDMDHNLKNNQSPDMKNLYWLDGALTCRPGQSLISDTEERGAGYCCYDGLFWGHAFFHIGSSLYAVDCTEAEKATDTEPLAFTRLLEGVPENRGTFFRYGDDLLYKNKGGYYRIGYNEDGSFTAGNVEPYAPITHINMEPTTHAGDEYQPENRLSPTQTVWYSVVEGVTKYCLPVTDLDSVDKVVVDEMELPCVDKESLPTYKAKPETEEDGPELVETSIGGQVTLTVTASDVTYQWQRKADGASDWTDCAGETGETLTIPDLTLEQTGDQYRCALTDGEGNVTETTGFVLYVAPVATCYVADPEGGLVTFDAPPKYHDPYVANTVKITFTKANEAAYNSIMDCCYAAVCGGDQNLCVVLGGCPAQPNAYFWCGNHIVMDAGYFPFEQYNFAGDTEERITGFGKQQAMLVIFKEKSIGRANLDTTEMTSGRTLLTMNYTNINARIGCDLPWTIQLCENNLVFCNTEGGVYILRDSTSAYENNVVSISRNVNGGQRKAGLLRAVRKAAVATSLNDGDRYWVVADGETYVWDFTLSTYSDPSWFYFTGIEAVDFLRNLDAVYHLDGAGRLTAMRQTYLDYGEGIEKVYQFAAQSLGGYNRLKDVLSVIFVTRADTDNSINVTYITDYEERADLTPIDTYAYVLFPRNLARGRNWAIHRFSNVARRKPGTRHVRHFSMRLENSAAAVDMSVVSAQIFYRYQGRDR